MQKTIKVFRYKGFRFPVKTDGRMKKKEYRAFYNGEWIVTTNHIPTLKTFLRQYVDGVLRKK